ncbi:hypothetical protein [Serratia fonticola]|uniref:hypothetical protein n=1 Tax=Serratia fonticola TaxID=47917 RepID=UPI00093CDDEB|nr:hypothetical protein [Serratia fonticola]OKP23821.1 hypothetical protein BSQ40_24295 [Serratia fonticola]
MKSETINQAWHKQLFDIGRDSRYHRARVDFWQKVEQGAVVILLVFLALSVVSALWHGLTMWRIALFSTVSVGAFAFAHWLGRRTQRHGQQRDSLMQLEHWATGRDINAESLGYLTAEHERITARAPPALLVLRALCHNDELAARGAPQASAFLLTRWQRYLAPFFDINSSAVKEQVRRRCHPSPPLDEQTVLLRLTTQEDDAQTPQGETRTPEHPQ